MSRFNVTDSGQEIKTDAADDDFGPGLVSLSELVADVLRDLGLDPEQMIKEGEQRSKTEGADSFDIRPPSMRRRSRKETSR